MTWQHKLDNLALLNIYTKATKACLDDEFIELIIQEIQKRNLMISLPLDNIDEIKYQWEGNDDEITKV